MITLKKRVISAFLAAVMLSGIIPAMPVFADEEPVLLETQRLENVEYDENISYTMMGTVQSEVDERGRYIITVYRCGNTSVESAVDLKTADVSAKYGIDYIIDDDRYTTETAETDGTLLELSADEERVQEGEEGLEDLQAMVDSIADTEENADKPEANADMFYITEDEDEESEDTESLYAADLFAHSFAELAEDEQAVKDEGKSSLAKLKEEQTGLETRPTYETDMEPVTNVIMNSMGVVDIAEHIETSSTTPLVFAPGETEKQIIIKILEDKESEGQEIINFMLSDPDENTELAEPITTSIIINDDEPVVHSKVSFAAEEFDTQDGVATVTVTRDEALYSYVTAKVRSVENGDAKEGKNYSLTDTQIEFRPYQQETSFEIPVAADKDMSFGLELYDLKGGEDGDNMTAQVNIDASENSDNKVSLLSSNSIEINGKTYALQREGNVAKIMDDDKVNPVHVGNYYYPTTDNVRYGYSSGDTYRRHNEYDEEEECGNLECYSGYVDYHGEEYAKFYFPAKMYQTAWLDFSSHSNWGNSWHGYRVYGEMRQLDQISGISFPELYYDFHRSYANERAVRGPIKLLRNDDKPPKSWDNCTMDIYAKRAGNGWIAPNTKFYGIALMFREFHVFLDQPGEMEFRTPSGTEKKRPARVELGRGQDTVYMNEVLTINSTATEDGGTIKGTLKGYEITAGDGAKPFFYETNSTSIKFDEDFVSLIDSNTSKVSESSTKGYFTKLYIKPVYDYIPVSMEVLPSTGGQFTDPALLESSEGVLHVGDTLSVNAEPALTGYYYDTYLLESYRNPGDTKPVVSGTMQKDSNEGKLELRERRYRVRPNFVDKVNYIEIQLDEEAEKYFEVLKTVPEDMIIDPDLQGKKLLYVSGDSPYVVPTVGKAYTVELTEKEGCNGEYRPKITREYTGEYVNGWAMDFIAEPLHGNNVIKVTAEKVPENSSDETHNVALDCLVQYSSVSVRQSTDALLNEPAIGAAVVAGTNLDSLYDRDGNLAKRPNRYNTTVDADGTAEILLKDVYYGDHISILVTNNDIDQVYYTTINGGEFAERKDKTFDYFEADAATKTNKYVSKTLAFEAGQDAPATVDMPIRTPYAPYVTDVRYSSVKHPEMDTRNNGVELYEDDALTFTAEINANGQTIKRVEFIRYNSGGEKKQTYEATKDRENVYSATADSFEISDGDKLYVRVVADAIVFNKEEDYQRIEKEYPTLNTGLNFYTPVIDVVPQHMEASTDQLGSLPVVGDMAADIDTGKLKWKTVYQDEKNKGTSARAEIVSLAVSLQDVKEAAGKLNEFKNGKSEEAKDAQKSVEDQLKEFDPHKEASAQDLQQLAQASGKGKTDEEKEAIVKKWTEKQKKAKRKELQSQQKKDSAAKMSKKLDWDIKFTVLLQFEYAYDYELNEHKFIGGQYLFGGAFNMKKTWYTIVYGLPVYLNVSGNISLQLDGVYTVADDLTILAKELKTEENLLNARFKNNNPWGQIGIGGKLQPGIGICGILGVRGVFTLNAVLRQLFDKTVEISSKSSGAMITMGGGVGVDLLLFSFDYNIGNLKFAWGVYNKDNVSLSSAEDEANISIRQLDRGKETDTIFGKEQINLMSSLEPVNKTDIVTGAMEYVRPEIVNLGDGRLMMIYLRNDETRDSANAASLVYTIKDNGVWSEPVYIDSDGTADGPADILCDGNKVYIAWSSTDTPATAGGDDINEVKQDLQKMNIRMCTYDTESDTLGNVITVTSDEYLNSDVRLAKENDDIALYYLKKDIQDADSAEKLISTTSNYSTWAKRVFDPDTNSFIKIISDGGSQVDEKLIYIKHPTISDPLVYDYAVEKYTYNNGTEDDTSDDVEYSIAAYSIDSDKNISTNDDREVWLEITDITDGKTYYPIKVSADSDNIINPKLTAVNGDVLLTWLSDTSVFNTISMTAFFEAMKNQTGNVDGTYTGTTAFDLMRSLTAEEAAQQDWGSVLEERAKASMSAGDIDSFDELFSSISDIVNGNFATNPKDFSDEGEQINMSDYQIVVGDDKNAYLFWTGAGLGLTNYGKELYGTAYYRLSDEWKETWGENDDMPDSGWGEPVQLTEYGEVIDEMTIAVDKNKNAVIIANMFEQTIDENGYVKQGEHKLAEIDCIPSNSLEIVNDEITMSDEYPVVGEPTTISFTVKNTGLLPSTGQDVAIKVLRDGNVVFEDSQKETGAKNAIFAGNEFEYSTEWTPESVDGDIEVMVEVGEEGTHTVNTASKKLEKKANIEFGYSYEWNMDKIFNEIRTYPKDTPEESMSAEAKAINDIIDDDNTTAFNHIVFIPVENTGNAPMSNITASAVHIDSEFKKGDTLGTSKAINLAAKESGLLAIPVKGGEEHYTKDGIMELMLTVNSGETVLDWGNLHETIFESENVGVIANDGIETKEMKKNETFTIEARAYPFDNMKEMSYFSLDPAVAQVSEDGVVTAVGGGTTIVSALDMVSGISDEIEVTVEGTEPTPTRKPSSGGGSSSKKTPAPAASAEPAPTASAEPTAEPTEMPKPTSEPSGETVNRFADVPQDVWYYDAVKAAFDRKLMVGVDDTHFEPETDVTRGMFVTTLYRLESEPEISTEDIFTDVAQDAYYSKAIAWANANGIVEGYSESEFAPDEKITREQMAAMIYRYVQYKGEGFTDDWMFMLDYVDSADVSEYAYEAMCWNTMNGIINGMDDNTLSPKTNSTRAQVAAVLVRLADVLENNKQ